MGRGRSVGDPAIAPARRYGALACCGGRISIETGRESELQAPRSGQKRSARVWLSQAEYRNLHHVHMKITLNLNDQLLADAKALAALAPA
jgi:hypothetical protein